ncbi:MULTISPECIES: hypothetical protein [Enterobacter cloacae complex]|uniref:hypothetical protein n=1 Tax=Enterobacter cloacae complex TaxID=354276 RepID=UPI0014780D96|nr:hypothetical protein [Enterobacter hormaechei]HDT3138715.1 hypothetical protein [Enterobacter asburiae]
MAIIQKMAPSVIIFLRFDTAKIPQQSDKLVLFASADFSGNRNADFAQNAESAKIALL